MRGRREEIRKNGKEVKRKNYSKQATNPEMNTLVNYSYWVSNLRYKKREKFAKKKIKERKTSKKRRKK